MRSAAANVRLDVRRFSLTRETSVLIGGRPVPQQRQAYISMIITNQNDFALTEIDLSCTNWTRDGPVPMSVAVRDVIGPGSINYVDRYVGLVDSSVGIECQVERVTLWSPGDGIQSRR